MRFERCSTAVLGLIAAYGNLQVVAVQLWPSPAAIPNAVPAPCRAALVQNITCPGRLITASDVVSGLSLSSDDASQYCTGGCHDSLAAFQTEVTAGCGTSAYTLYENSSYTQSPAALADSFVWAYGVSCIQDSSGYCLASLYDGNKTSCSDCALKYGAAMLSSDYGRTRITPDAFSSLLSSCSANPASYTYTYTPTPTTTATNTATTTPAASPTCKGQTYTVQNGDTCPSISKAKGVGTDLMINRNKLDYNCTALTPSTSLCLQDTCTIKTLDRTYTCDELVRNQNFYLAQLIAWNPSIHSKCDNLDTMIGRSICLSPPGGGSFDVNITISQQPTPTLASSLFTSWVSVTGVASPLNITTSWYTPTVDPNATPSITSTASYNSTVASILPQYTQYCWLTGDDWDNGFNEQDYAAGCQSLMNEYCFPDLTGPVPTSPAHIPAVCTPDRAAYPTDTGDDDPDGTGTGSSATPTPFQPDMVTGCQKFYEVASGDTCQSVADQNGITLDQFYTWNPDVGGDCHALLQKYYVCVAA